MQMVLAALSAGASEPPFYPRAIIEAPRNRSGQGTWNGKGNGWLDEWSVPVNMLLKGMDREGCMRP